VKFYNEITVLIIEEREANTVYLKCHKKLTLSLPPVCRPEGPGKTGEVGPYEPREVQQGQLQGAAVVPGHSQMFIQTGWRNPWQQPCGEGLGGPFGGEAGQEPSVCTCSGLVVGDPARGRGVETGWSLWSFSTQATLWFYDCNPALRHADKSWNSSSKPSELLALNILAISDFKMGVPTFKFAGIHFVNIHCLCGDICERSNTMSAEISKYISQKPSWNELNGISWCLLVLPGNDHTKSSL